MTVTRTQMKTTNKKPPMKITTTNATLRSLSLSYSSRTRSLQTHAFFLYNSSKLRNKMFFYLQMNLPIFVALPLQSKCTLVQTQNYSDKCNCSNCTQQAHFTSAVLQLPRNLFRNFSSCHLMELPNQTSSIFIHTVGSTDDASSVLCPICNLLIFSSCNLTFSALMLLAGRQEGHLDC